MGRPKIKGVCKECGDTLWAKGYCKMHYGLYQMSDYRDEHPEYVSNSRERSRLKRRKDRENPENRLKFNQECKEWRRNLKYEVLSHYSSEQPKCAKCGFNDIRALCIDHINNDGSAERKIVGSGSVTFYRWIKKNQFPDRYQVLCANCNTIKQRDLENNV